MVVAFLPASDAHPAAAKGIQVVVVDGEILESPVRVLNSVPPRRCSTALLRL
jgi:hypothetical protein